MSFYKTFQNLLDNKDPLDQKYERIKDTFTTFDYNILPKVVTTIHAIAPFLLQNIKHKQHVIKRRDDYYIARDIQDDIVYMCFKNLMIIDIDTLENSESEIIEYFTNLPGSYEIYKSNRGYHVFCTSQPVDYRADSTLQFLLDHKCDFYYIIYSYIRGFCVRLNKKPHEICKVPYTFVGAIRQELASPRLLYLVNKHFQITLKKN